MSNPFVMLAEFFVWGVFICMAVVGFIGIDHSHHHREDF